MSKGIGVNTSLHGGASGTRRFAGIVCALVFAAGMAVQASDPYVDANRRIYYFPAQAGLAYSDLCFARDGAPNSNPAALMEDASTELQLSYSGYFRNTYSSSMLSYVTSLERIGAIGVSLNYVYVPDVLDNRGWETTSGGAPIVPPVSEWDYATVSEIYAHAAYAYRWDFSRLSLSAGLGLNVLRRRLLEWTGYGIGLDGGLQVHFANSGVRAGLIVENLTTSYMNWSKEYDEIALPHARVGVGWRREFPYVYGAIQLSYTSPDLLANEGVNGTSFLTEGDSAEAPVEMHLPEDPQLLFSGNYGIEYTIANVVSVRVGLANVRRFTFGAGVALLNQMLLVDFAYLPHQLGGSYAFSVGCRWP
ncbi:MAG: hypothetical protein GF331_06230 [Chitinivibrionales bacterium]|nr:hypothetical protein [Chitinivibrionales bacterium]